MVKIKKYKKEEKEDQLLENPKAISETLDSYELFFQKNKKIISTVLGVLIFILTSFLLVNYYISTQNKLAQDDMFQAVYYFESDSLVKALNGDGNNFGFLEIIDEYNFTNAANLSYFYAGSAYMKLGDFENAIKYLKEFDGNDKIVQARSYSLIGDAYTELEDYSSAIVFFKKAVFYNPNKFFTPSYLLKLALVYEENGEFEDAYDCYSQIVKSYKESSEYQISVKNKSRLEGLI